MENYATRTLAMSLVYTCCGRCFIFCNLGFHKVFVWIVHAYDLLLAHWYPISNVSFSCVVYLMSSISSGAWVRLSIQYITCIQSSVFFFFFLFFFSFSFSNVSFVCLCVDCVMSRNNLNTDNPVTSPGIAKKFLIYAMLALMCTNENIIGLQLFYWCVLRNNLKLLLMDICFF